MRLHGRGVCSLRRAFSLSLPTFHTSVRTLIIVRPPHFVASKAEAIGTGLASRKHPSPSTHKIVLLIHEQRVAGFFLGEGLFSADSHPQNWVFCLMTHLQILHLLPLGCGRPHVPHHWKPLEGTREPIPPTLFHPSKLSSPCPFHRKYWVVSSIHSVSPFLTVSDIFFLSYLIIIFITMGRLELKRDEHMLSLPSWIANPIYSQPSAHIFFNEKKDRL